MRGRSFLNCKLQNLRCKWHTLVIVMMIISLHLMYFTSKPSKPLKLSMNTEDYLPDDMKEYIKNQITMSSTVYSTRPRGPYKIFLLYTPFFGMSNWGMELGTKLFSKCPEHRCIVTNDKRLYNISDGLLFHLEEMPLHPPPKRLGQRWIMYSMESPVAWKLRRLELFRHSWLDMFNYTSTYRFDSDFPTPYGIIGKRSKPIEVKKDYRSIMRKKTKLLSWVVSNCYADSLRLPFANELMKYIPMDIYGKCGKYSCPRKDNIKCRKLFTESYKFFFVAENSFCEQYATEKLFTYFPLDVVPIVRGGANYSHILPAGTYINTGDFPSVKELADYLLYLDKHPDEYMEYLQKKEQYYVYGSDVWCDICKNLNTPSPPVKYYHDLVEWWGEQGCYDPPDRSLFYQSSFDSAERGLMKFKDDFGFGVQLFFKNMFYN